MLFTVPSTAIRLQWACQFTKALQLYHDMAEGKLLNLD
jgi:hypothetical protein